jgi:hypothetical protein
MLINGNILHKPCVRDYHSRRDFLYAVAGLTVSGLLTGCGGDGDSSATAAPPAAAVPASATAAVTDPGAPSTEVVKLNLALNIEYLGAEFYAYASNGVGLSSSLVAGIGKQGVAIGGRQVNFSDVMIRQQASDLAADKLANVIALRTLLAGSAAALPALDFSASPRSAFSTAAQAAGVAGPGAPFDAFSNDENFLLGAFLLEYVVAAAYRAIVTDVVTPATLQVLNANLADAIFHNGLVRTMLATKAVDDASLALSVTSISTYLASLDGSGAGDQSLQNATGESANIIDDSGNAIPFVRDQNQVLQALYLTPVAARSGGFLPNGANGLGI